MSRFQPTTPTYEVWVKNRGELTDAIGSHLVPTYLLGADLGPYLSVISSISRKI